MEYIHQLHQTMKAENLILVYEGEFTQEITKSVLSMTERNLESVGEESAIKRKVFNVMVECLQNIVKHAEEPALKVSSEAVFMIGKEEGSYIIASGNFIENDKVDWLKGKLDQINGLDKAGLKELYKSIIKGSDGLSEKGGAGLGFIDMARKSGQPLGYHFEKADDDSTFFALKSTISRIKETV